MSESKPIFPGAYYGQASPEGEWIWKGTGSPDDDWTYHKEEQIMPEERDQPPSVDDAATALVDKLLVLTAKSPIHTGHGYLHIIGEGELEPELSDLAKLIHPELYPEPEPPPAEEPAAVEAPTQA